MSLPPFSTNWLNQFTDPYAVLGVSVAADERRILKRYHRVAKQLHPDIQADHTAEYQDFVNQVLAKLVNPAYQRLKQDKNRSETLATLRFKVRRLVREDRFKPQGECSRRLLATPEAEVDLVYEHALDQLSEHQYKSVAAFTECTQQISELNLTYFRRKMGEAIIREKRTGLVSATTHAPVVTTTAAAPTEVNPATYADRHFRRAHDYLKAKNAAAAIPELKDALKLDPKNSNYHCLIGQAYLMENLPGMAKVHFKQALRINPNNSVALKYARQLKIDPATTTPQSSDTVRSAVPPKTPGRLFSRLFAGR